MLLICYALLLLMNVTPLRYAVIRCCCCRCYAACFAVASKTLMLLRLRRRDAAALRLADAAAADVVDIADILAPCYAVVTVAATSYAKAAVHATYARRHTLFTPLLPLRADAPLLYCHYLCHLIIAPRLRCCRRCLMITLITPPCFSCRYAADIYRLPLVSRL